MKMGLRTSHIDRLILSTCFIKVHSLAGIEEKKDVLEEVEPGVWLERWKEHSGRVVSFTRGSGLL
jgi:hypothetical protein